MKLEDIRRGARESGDSGYPMDELPSWIDPKRFLKGQEFIMKHFFAILLALHCSLTAGFSLINLLVPLVYTNQSDTQERALRRYLTTFEHLHSWFTGDVWDTESGAHSSVKSVRAMHSRVASSMRKDFPKNNHISQYDMALVQSGFMGAIVMYPDGFGIRYTQKELEDFVYFWRGIGYLLGIKDKYNICSEGLSEAYNLCKEIENEILLPALKDPPRHFEQMSDAYSEGINIPFKFRMNTTKSTLAFMYNGMDIEMPKMGFGDWLRFLRYKLFVFLIRWLPGYESYINRRSAKMIKALLQKYVYSHLH